MPTEDGSERRQHAPQHAHREENVVPPKDEEFELVPLSPVRRLEKRLDKIEHAGVPTESIKELVEVVRENQQVVEEIVKLNTEMVRRVSDLTSSISELSTRVNDLVMRMKMAEVPEEKERQKEAETKLNERLDKLEKRLNTLIVATLPRRPRMPQQMMAPPPAQMM